MKQLYFTFILFMLFSFCQAQTCSTICDNDLLNGPFPFSNFSTAGPINYSIPGGITSSHYHDVDYNNALCNPVMSCSQQINDLIYKVYYPSGYTKSQFIACPLPCIIVVHGSDFLDCKKYTLIQGWCEDFAKLGFVAFNIEYRRGTLNDPSGRISAQAALAVYRACQDVRGAISSIIYRQTQEGISVDDNYRIDTSRLFLAGKSAGGLAVLCAAYYNQNMMDELLPAVSPGVDLETVCGSLDAHWYDNGDNNTMNYYRQHIKGILVQSAGMYVPYSFHTHLRDFFEVMPYIPVIFFHGQNDATFNVDSANLNFSLNTNTTYNSTSFCTDATNGSVFKVNSDNSPNIKEYGSKGIYSVLLQNSSYTLIPSEFYKDCQMGHTLDANGTTPYLTDFGTGVTSHDDIIQYITSRGAIFFGDIIAGVAGSLNKTKFVECKNNRIKCNTADNFDNTCCSSCVDDSPDANKCNINQNQLP